MISINLPSFTFDIKICEKNKNYKVAILVDTKEKLAAVFENIKSQLSLNSIRSLIYTYNSYKISFKNGSFIDIIFCKKEPCQNSYDMIDSRLIKYKN